MTTPTKIQLIKLLREMYPGLNLRDAKVAAELAMDHSSASVRDRTPEFFEARNHFVDWLTWAPEYHGDDEARVDRISRVTKAHNWGDLRRLADIYGYTNLPTDDA